MAKPKFRRTRIVCISDTHNCTVSLPPGDVLIHAGDLTNQGSYSELSKTIRWLEAADYEAKIVVAGNHDITLDSDFYFHHGKTFHNDFDEQKSADCLALLTSSPSITYLCHDSATIRLKSPEGPHTEFTVFGSPYSPRHGLWAFYYDAPTKSNDPEGQGQTHGEREDGDKVDEEEEEVELTALWELIPLEADIVVTHTPPRTHRDDLRSDGPRREGCEALRQALWRVRPKLAVCGHIHSKRGAERVTWDLRNPRVPFAEKSIIEWEDPGQGSGKQSLVDLTGRRDRALDNDGSYPGRPGTKNGTRRGANGVRNGQDGEDEGEEEEEEDDDDDTALSDPSRDDSRSSVGYGVSLDSFNRCDCEALRGRMGRRETCIVNAAILKTSHPHAGGKEFNKPIVVDVDLPVWEED
ncbi:putative rhamnogalacturonate lyase C [Escovopsis weberi]|uniref:Putative rhamnogalacturonate lyase C n=1 Tax=Escovopsis weberi TaxID=150374 RepID=A0A0M9VS54_ESCWE|nr:putative rhamnogalacturonate lyase C [Escovopsis weberi]